jgi:alpha-tubulin suppressor-like RCC1 family protein
MRMFNQTRYNLVLFLLTLTLICFIMVVPSIVVSSNGSSDSLYASHTFVAVATGGGTLIALRDDGTVWTWGNMYSGEPVYTSVSGHNMSKYFWGQTTPIQVPISDVVAIAAGDEYSLALKKDGTVWAWGSNFYGELGDGTTTGTSKDNISIVQVKGLNNVIAISAGSYYSIALKNDGTVWAWGGNWDGHLGDGTRDNRLTPVQVNGLSNVTSIWGASFAIKDDGSVWTWGPTFSSPFNNDSNDRGDLIPYQIPGLANVKAIDTDQDGGLTIFIKDDGSVWTWGTDYNGRLGYGANPNNGIGEIPYVTTPVQAKNLTNVVAVAATYDGGMALKDDGSVWTWGHDGSGELDTGNFGIQYVPEKALDINNVIAISSKTFNSIFLKEDGSVWVCGSGDNGQAGNGMMTYGDGHILVPVKVLGPDATVTPTVAPTIGSASTNPSQSASASTRNETSSTPVPSPGFTFSAFMILGSILIVVDLLFGFRLQKK